MKLLLVLSVGAMAAVPLLAPSPAQALTACASVTTTLTAAQSCTIDDGGTTYSISLQTGTFPNAFPSPSTTTMFWWGDAIKAGSAASAVGKAFGDSFGHTFTATIYIGPLFAYSHNTTTQTTQAKAYSTYSGNILDFTLTGTTIT